MEHAVQPDKGGAADGIDDIFIKSHERSSPLYVRFLSGGTMECRINDRASRSEQTCALKCRQQNYRINSDTGKKYFQKREKPVLAPDGTYQTAAYAAFPGSVTSCPFLGLLLTAVCRYLSYDTCV
jgi:hypothetical protein